MSEPATEGSPSAKPGAVGEQRPVWPAPVGEVAGAVVRDLAPRTVLDVGCGAGLLVEALLDRGVDVHGLDFWESRLGAVREDTRARCGVTRADTPFDRRVDLVTCIDVTEQLSDAEAIALIANICDHTDDVLFASRPPDGGEPPSRNAHPPEHWAELLAGCGLHRDLDYDATYLAPWAGRFQRRGATLPSMVRTYERELWRLRQHGTQDGPDRPDAEAVRLRGEVARLSHELSAQQQLYIRVSEALRRQEEDIRQWRRQGTVRVAEAIQHAVAVVAPPNTVRRRSLYVALHARAVLAAEGPSGLRRAISERRLGREAQQAERLQAQYTEWLRRHEPTPERLRALRDEGRAWSHRPLISVLMPTYESNLDWLRPAIDSVLAQAYENWQLCIADDGSKDPRVRACLEGYAAADPRVVMVFRPENGGISAASAAALELATGDFVALLDHDDLLRPHALHGIVQALQADAVPDIVYSDEDLKLVDGRLVPGFFKPDWSPDLLTSVNYMCHLAVLRTSLVRDVGGFRPGFDGSQDHDLLLRATERATNIAHVADVLYSWRQVPGSVALQSDAKMYAYDAGRRAVADALERRGLQGQVTLGKQLGTYHVRLAVTGSPRVAIVIPTRDRLSLLRACIESIETLSTYSNWSITIVDNDSTLPETLEYLSGSRHRVVRMPGHFNYSKLINFGRSQVDGDHLLTLNNDVRVRTPDWIEAMLEQAQRAEVGVVGARLLYPDGRPQHEGIGVGNIGDASTAVNLDAGWLGTVIRDVSAVTGACQMTRLAVFDEVHGYDEGLHVGYNDVDFCLRVRRAGYLVVYTPHAELIHDEGATRGPLNPAADEQRFFERWALDGGLRDPFTSPHVRKLNPLVLRVGDEGG